MNYIRPILFIMMFALPAICSAQNLGGEDVEEETVHIVVEQMPTFIGCGELEGKERKDCSNEKVMEFIAKNLVYPKEAKNNGIEGTAIVYFEIHKDGSVKNIMIRKNAHPLLDKAAIDVVRKFPKWEPGKQLGRSVVVSQSLPIKFELN